MLLWAFLLFVVIPRVREHSERLLPDIKSIRTHRGGSFVFDNDLVKAVIYVKGDRTADVSIIFKAAKYFVNDIFSKKLQVHFQQHLNLIIRKEYLNLQQEFTGSFPTTYESNSLPPILKSF